MGEHLRQFTPYELADQAIGLFLEYRDVHGYAEAEARTAAAREVAEGASVTAADLGEADDAQAPALCPGGCGCRLGTDDADRRECGCDAGCCDAQAEVFWHDRRAREHPRPQADDGEADQ